MLDTTEERISELKEKSEEIIRMQQRGEMQKKVRKGLKI